MNTYRGEYVSRENTTFGYQTGERETPEYGMPEQGREDGERKA
ncbi:MAG: hypothetical protein ACK493_12830 [Planctomycetota bacterium]